MSSGSRDKVALPSPFRLGGLVDKLGVLLTTLLEVPPQQQANLPRVAFEFLDAPYASGAPPSAPLDDAPAGASARCWWRERWNGDLGRVDYEGAERSVAAVLARLAASADRPCDGLLGEGQGGELAAVVLAMQIRGEFPRGVPRSLRYGWVQNASVPRDGAVARLLGDGRARRGPVLEGDAFAEASVSRGAVLDLGMQR